MSQDQNVRSSLITEGSQSLTDTSSEVPATAEGAIAAQRQGAPEAPVPFLDIGGGNVPPVSSARPSVASESLTSPPGHAAGALEPPGASGARSSWSKKQWMTRRAVVDRLRYWQASGYQCLWVTLTSAPGSPLARLRKDFQVLRKRVGREFGFESFEYVCVDTIEGHGVLHMIWAWADPDTRKKASFYIAFDWLQAQWKAIHGAFHVNVKRIGNSDTDARRLSRYIVAQYCGDQDGLVRLSQSRMAISLTRMRQALLGRLKCLPELYPAASIELAGCAYENSSRELHAYFWREFRTAWDQLVRGRSCRAFGVQFIWWDNELTRV